MKTGVTFTNRKVFVNKDKGTVAVKEFAFVPLIDHPEVMDLMDIPEVLDFVRNYLDVPNQRKCAAKVETGMLWLEASATAKCNTEVDKFDETFGVHLATTRAQEKIFDLTAKFFERLADYVEEKFYNKLTAVVSANYRAANDCYVHEQLDFMGAGPDFEDFVEWLEETKNEDENKD